jgi:hypothetical protein
MDTIKLMGLEEFKTRLVYAESSGELRELAKAYADALVSVSNLQTICNKLRAALEEIERDGCTENDEGNDWPGCSAVARAALE